MSRPPTTQSITPPYISVAKLEKTLDLISNRNSTEITVNLFMGFGFSRTDALLSMSALRFLGLVDENDKPTELVQKLRLRGDVKTQEYEKIVRNAYKKLFEARENPQNLTSDELANEFTISYNLSPRIVRTVIPVFLKLCELAGLKPAGSQISRPRQPKTKTGEPIVKVKKTVTTNLGHAIIPLHTDLSLTNIVPSKVLVYFPTEWQDKRNFDDKFNTRLTNVIKEFKAIADDYLPKENSAPKES